MCCCSVVKNMDCQQRHTALALILGLFIQLIFAQDGLYQCPEGWELRGQQCYKFFSIRHSWMKAAEICRRHGSDLVLIEDFKENNFTLQLASKELSEESSPDYWLGLKTVDDLSTHTLESASGSFISQYSGFWSLDQPKPTDGECVYGNIAKQKQSWKLGTCESMRPFLCRTDACPEGSYHCSNGRCINSAFKCDGQNDCGDLSDEMDCPKLCHFYMKSSGDSIESPNYPQKYGSNLDCKWTLEGPQGYNIVLQFSDLDTEKNFDTVQILSGGRTEDSAVTISTLSGQQDLSSKLFVSASNLMVIKFKSDASVEKKGFRASWKTEPKSCGGNLIATSQPQELTSPNYPQHYPGGLECLYIIKGISGRVISLEFEDIDLEYGKDFILIRNGASPSDPRLLTITGNLTDNTRFLSSVANKLYLFIRTDFGNSGRGFKIKYFSGCKATIENTHGKVNSPAYGVLPYPNNQECIYHIKHPSNGPLSLKFVDFDVDDNDFVQVFDGENEGSIRLYPGDGFTGHSTPNIVLTASSGHMYIKFNSDPLKSARGWEAEFSADCPVLSPGEGASSSSRDTHFGTKVIFKCPTGQEFATGVSKIVTECQKGGKWTTDYIPDCQEVYCGPVPQIDNGFAIASTNVTYNGQATYQCYAGFGFASGLPTETVQCQAEGQWETLPICLASQCPPLPDTPHAMQTILNGGGRSYGTIIRFECEPGYFRSGMPTLLCMSNGTWSGPVPQCSRIQCHEFPRIENGFISNKGREYFYGDETRVQCHRGYQLVGSNTITCGPQQEFINLPRCEDINECLSTQCDAASTDCTNTPGAFFCKCKSGFKPNLECRPVGDLGLNNGGVPDSAIIASGSELTYEKEFLRLDGPRGWCGSFQGPNANWVIIDMQAPTVIKGFRTRSVKRDDGSDAYASILKLQYTDDLTDIFREYRTPDGTPVEFRIVAGAGPSVVNFPIPVEARYFKFIVQDFTVAPCMRMELMGCARQDCIDINECEKENGGCQQRCLNSPGSFSCGCNLGYELFTSNGTAGFTIKQSETGNRDGDSYRLNKTCVPKMCPKLLSPPNGVLESTKEMYHFGDTVSFMCDFGYVMIGNPVLTCTSNGEWNGTIPVCEFAKCASLQDDPAEGLVVRRANRDDPLVGFRENITIECNEIGKPIRDTATAGFRQCVFDPKPGFPFDYWLSGSPPGCPRIDCGIPPETPGAEYGFFVDTSFRSSFFFGCEETFSLAGQTSKSDNVVRCQEDGTWDFGDLRCEGPVCEDPGHPPDGQQIATSYEQGSEVSFSCDRPGYITIYSQSIVCQRSPECRVIKPLGITSGKIPDAALNATTQRPNYEAKNVRLNSATGWCAQPEAFSYVSADLGKIHRIKAILVKGVITNDVVGRPTDIRFFYKKEESESFIVYFPNFNLTIKEPGNYGELSMIMLPSSVQARYVILSIVSYDKNPCLKFELMGCEDEDEEDLLLGYDMGYPVCVDNEPPQFLNCPSEPILVKRGPDGFDLVNFTVPTVVDNSGGIARMEIEPQGFRPPLHVFEDMLVRYLAFDYDGNIAICEINITIVDTTPPNLNCPRSYVIELVEPLEKYEVNFRDVESQIEAIDDFDPNPTLTFIPESMTIPVGNFENVTVIATDKSGNQEMCHFQVAIQATPCVAWDLKAPQSGTINCLPSESGTGLNCLASCNPGHRFTDGEAVKTFVCEKKQPWVPSKLVPDCVPEDTELANYDVVSSVTYRANGVVSPQCIPQYQGLLKQYYANLGELLSQRCSAINVPMNVSFRASGMNVIQDNMLDINFVLRVTPEVRQPLLYDLCGSTLGLIFDLSVPSTSIVIEPLLNVSAVGNQCPPLRAVKSDVSRGFTCNIGEVLTKVDNGVPRCLHCPAGTAATDQRNCIPCSKGMYQDVTRQAECKPCPIGTYTKEEGSKSLRECIPVCGYGTHSPTGLVPCLECPKNSFTAEPPRDGFKECQDCPLNTFTYSTASPSPDLCRAKCKPGFYSVTGLEPCSPCPKHFYQPLEGQTSCFECATTEQTVTIGTDSRGKCQAVPCNENVCRNGGLCVARGHSTTCLCPAGFSGRFCEVDISECDSNPCFNGATCVDLPQGYICQCPPGFTGFQCQDEDGDCGPNTCPERAMCQDLPGVGEFKCLCKSGYTGPDCNVTVNPCIANGNPCQNSAICIPLLQGRFKCDCPPGWSGPLCDINIDDCSEAPCLLGANCTDLVNDFKCDCPRGFTGKRCEVKINLCADGPCQNGLCIDHLFEYSCACNPGWTGPNCDVNIDDCASNPCDHGSECVDMIDTYMCNCLPGYTGSRCQHTIDDCEPSPCQNGATCVDGLDGFVCECRPGFVGLQCEAEIDECLSNPCNSVGTSECQDLDNDFKCVCQPGYDGEFCENNIDECKGNPCLNGGSCADSVNKFICTCPEGWTGERCETDISSCEFDTCLNDAECINLFEDYFCACPSGTDGKRCQIAPERCIGEPCMHGGTCQDFGSGLNCSCPVDYAGVGCQYEYDACKEGICQNGATCIDNGPGYKCMCAPGFTGELCDVDMIDCQPGSCPPGSQCIDLINDFYCKCPFNLTGEDCRKPINHNYDLYFNDESRASRASLNIPFSLTSISSFTLSFWVRFSFPDDFGTYFTLYTVSSPHIPMNKRAAIQAHNLGVLVNLFDDSPETFFNFRPQIPINDGQWHHISLVWDNYAGSVTLTTDAVIVETKTGYGVGKVLDTNGWIVLGAPMSESKSLQQLGFHGHISRVFVWNRPLDVKSEIPKQARNCRNAPVLFDGLIQQWTGFDLLKGNVERISPSECGDRVCPLGYSEDCSVIKEDKISPEVIYCPGDIWVITKNGSATVNWDPARFVDNKGVKEVREWNNYSPGQVLSLGTHHISYIAYDEVGNSAACSFKIYVLTEFCPQPEDPEGGFQRCSDWGPGGRFKVCRISCDFGKKFSQPVPEFYTCGAEGFWRPTMDPSMPLIYPACATADPAQRVFNIKMEFPSSVICNPAGEGVLKDRIKAALLRLNKEWSLCSGSGSGQGICNDLFVGVKCQKKSHVVKRQTDSNNVYSVEITFPANADPIDSRNTNDKEEIKRLVESIILEKAAFDVGDTLPNVIPDPASLELNSDYQCPVGKVVVPPDCVSCTFGTFYQNATKSCQLCPSGTYQNELGQTECKKCPTIGGRQGVTSMPGARSSNDCKERCPPGKFYEYDISLCRPCGFGMYQPEEGSFQCLTCPAGFTTRSKEAISVDECHEECPSGEQLDSNGNCQSCERGSYRTKGQHIVCQECPTGTTTLESGATTVKDCSLPVCAPGTFLNSTQGVSLCSPCPKGTYQPSPQQSSCISCPPDTSTRNTSSITKDECTNPCAVHGEERLCDRNAHCLFKPDINDFDCECLPGFNGTGYQCVDLCDNYCVNEGVCEKTPDGEPFCQCVGSFTGKTCEGRTIFAYLAGGIAGAIVLIILVVLMIWMICARTTRKKDPKKLLSSTVDHTGSQVNFYYGAPAPYAESIAPSHHSTYAHYYDDEEDGWEMPNFYNDTYMKEGLPNGKATTLARSNASLYGTRQDDLYDRLRKHAYQGKREKGDTASESDDHLR